MNNNNSNMFGTGLFFGLAIGAGLAYLYGQNKELVDGKVKEAYDKTSDYANEKFKDATKATSDTLQKSGKGISSLGSKLAKQISEKADEFGDMADEAAKNIRKNTK